ncbi:MAG: ACT domain-containing protein [candidate division Zixibacteria bacterium]|nr:ACT domain-containing protein [candidate division Zixibacteria bacterium]
MTEAASTHVSHPQIEPTDSNRSRVIVATFGRNRPGVAAALTAVLAEHNCDIADITQKILQEFFSMIMIVDIANCSVDFATLRQKFGDVETRLGVTIVAQHEDVFRAMHRV